MRAAVARLDDRHRARAGRAGCAAPAVVRPAFTLGGHGGGFAVDRRGASPPGRARARRVADRAGARRGVAPRLGRVRARGRPRPRRQRRDRLLDREPRPDGRPHRRLGHGRPADDALRRGLPGAARRGDRGRPRGRSRHRRLEHPVRARAGHRRAARGRDEPARLALLGARLEGDRLPDREGRGAARGRLHARRDPERPHRHDPGELRADARLRGRQDAAVRVREVPRRRPHARHADEVGRRVDGDRPHLRRGLRQGPPRARARARLAAGGAAPLVCGRARTARAEHGSPVRAARVALPARRLVRGRGRGRLELLLLDARRARRAAARAGPLGRDPRQRPEPDRAGDRVRLLLRPRGRELPRAGLRGGDGQLQPGDRLDRLRHLRPALLRAARRGGRARGARARAAGRRLHPVRRPDAAQARARDRAAPASGSSARRSTRSTSPRTASASAGSPPGSASAARSGGSRSSGDEAVAIAARIGYPVLVRPSYVLGGRAMRVCYDEPEVRAAMAAVEGAVLVDRFLENAIELDVDALCDGADTLRRRGDGARRGGRDPLRRLVVRAAGAVGLRRDPRAWCAGSGPRSASSGCSTSSSRSTTASVYVLEVNPRASRTVPFASKATGVNLVDAACRLAGGRQRSPSSTCRPKAAVCAGHHVKAAVLPFVRFAGADPVLGPEMRSTGEVMASGADFATAFAKAERAAGRALPTGGRAFLSVRDADKVGVVPRSRRRSPRSGSSLVATSGTARRARARRGSRSSASTRASAVVELVRGARRRPRRQHAAGPERPPRRLRDPRGRGDRAGALHHARSPSLVPPSRRSRTRAARSRAHSRSGRPRSWSRRIFVRRRERLSVVGVEAIGPYTLFRARARDARARARPGSSSCSRRPAGPCRARSRSASRRDGSSGFSSTRSAPGRRRSPQLEPGDEIAVFGPLGNGFRLDRPAAPAGRRRDRRRAVSLPCRGARASARGPGFPQRPSTPRPQCSSRTRRS